MDLRKTNKVCNGGNYIRSSFEMYTAHLVLLWQSEHATQIKKTRNMYRILVEKPVRVQLLEI
jgi:hypothetical protein